MEKIKLLAGIQVHAHWAAIQSFEIPRQQRDWQQIARLVDIPNAQATKMCDPVGIRTPRLGGDPPTIPPPSTAAQPRRPSTTILKQRNYKYQVKKTGTTHPIQTHIPTYNPNLLAALVRANTSKGDRNTAKWLPDNSEHDYRQRFVVLQIAVKARYRLSVAGRSMPRWWRSWVEVWRCGNFFDVAAG